MRIRYSFSSRKTGTLDEHNQHRKEYPKIALQVINEAEIILEVLDARFIEETRIPELEKEIIEKGKKIVYVLNKSDLADEKEIKKKLDLLSLYPYVFVSCRSRKGSHELRERIKIEAKKIKKEKVQIGVIGYPNTGKSSIINLLVGKSSAGTSKEAGFTKGIQKIKLSGNIIILDTPGVIPEKEYSSIDNKALVKHAQIGVRTYDKIREPELVLHKIMNQFPGMFENFYNIDAKGNSDLIIEQLGKKWNLLRKGNQVDRDRTVRRILKDWQDGKIKAE